MYIGDRFLKFHLVQNFFFYLVLFTIPAVSAIDCVHGHTIVNLIAISIFMMCVLVIDFINLRQHVKKELIKLELKNFYGKNKDREYTLHKIMIYGEAALEMFLT